MSDWFSLTPTQLFVGYGFNLLSMLYLAKSQHIKTRADYVSVMLLMVIPLMVPYVFLAMELKYALDKKKFWKRKL